jgi:hypothetical protein
MSSQTDREIIQEHENLFDLSGELTSAMHRGFENVGQGWLPILAQLCERLVPLAQDDVRIVAVKSKYGDLRVNYRGGDDATDTAVGDARASAARTCQMCGAPGERRTVGGELVVSCAGCGG